MLSSGVLTSEHKVHLRKEWSPCGGYGARAAQDTTPPPNPALTLAAGSSQPRPRELPLPKAPPRTFSGQSVSSLDAPWGTEAQPHALTGCLQTWSSCRARPSLSPLPSLTPATCTDVMPRAGLPLFHRQRNRDSLRAVRMCAPSRQGPPRAQLERS